MIFFGSTWQGTVSAVAEYDSGYPPEIKMNLWRWRTDIDDPPAPQCLPRAGEKYWLVRDDMFQILLHDLGSGE